MTELEKDIVKLVKEGYSIREISMMPNQQYGYKKINETFKELKQQGMITEQDIKEGKEERRRREIMENPIIRKIFQLKREGLSDSQIARMPEIGITQPLVSRYVREGKRLGLINQEEIEQAEKDKKEKEKNDNPDRKRVLEGLRRGELDTEIAKDTIVGYQQVKNIRLSLIKEGIITQKEIDEAREKAKSNKQQEKKENSQIEENIPIDEARLLGYLILGYDAYKIKEKMTISGEQYNEIVIKLIREKRITRQEIKDYRERKEKEDKAKVLEGLKKGLSQRTIAKGIDCSLEKTQTYIRKIQEEENISDEDILHWKNEKETSVEKRKEVVLEGLKKGLSRNEIIAQYPLQQLSKSDIRNCRNTLVNKERTNHPRGNHKMSTTKTKRKERK